jgi:hypothetical protein
MFREMAGKVRNNLRNEYVICGSLGAQHRVGDLLIADEVREKFVPQACQLLNFQN